MGATFYRVPDGSDMDRIEAEVRQEYGPVLRDVGAEGIGEQTSQEEAQTQED